MTGAARVRHDRGAGGMGAVPRVDRGGAGAGWTLRDRGVLSAASPAALMHFWAGKDCAAVTEIIAYPKGKVLNLFAGGGARGRALKELKAMEPAFVAWARAAGASKIISFGSHASWKPVGERLGYRHLWTVMQKDI